ncbi:MAG: TonB-dependent receptor [Pseudomonadota bacterium]
MRGLRDGAVPSLLRENSLPGGLVYRPDPYAVERIEVIKRPVAIAGGGASVGGLINRQLKVADGEQHCEAILTADPFGFFRAGVDIGGAFDPAGNTSGRLVVVGGAGDGERDRESNENLHVLGSLLFNIGANTQFTLQAQVVDRGGNPANGVAIDPRSDGLPDLDRTQSLIRDDDDVFIDQQHYSGQADLVHQFLDDLTLTARVGYAETDGDQVQIYPFTYSGLDPSGEINVYAGYTDDDYTRFAGDIFLTKTFNLFGQESAIVGGIDYFEQRQDFLRTFNFLGTENLFDISTPFSAPDTVQEEIVFIDNETALDQFGAYLQVVLRPTPQLTLNGGVRYDTFDQDSEVARRNVGGDGNAGSIGASANEVTWRAGASYQVTPSVTAYCSYATSFLANAFSLTADNSFIDPEQGEQFEVGLRTSLFDDRLNATVAAYTIDRIGVPIFDFDNFGFFVPGGEGSYDGIEVELAGEPIEGLRILGANAYLDAQITEDGDPNTGNLTINVPDHRLSIFSSYEWQEGPLKGFGVGGRVEYQSEAPFITAEDPGLAPSFVTLDLTAFYRDILPGADLHVYAQNVTDETFYPVGGQPTGFGGFGSVRTATASLVWGF